MEKRQAGEGPALDMPGELSVVARTRFAPSRQAIQTKSLRSNHVPVIRATILQRKPSSACMAPLSLEHRYQPTAARSLTLLQRSLGYRS